MADVLHIAQYILEQQGRMTTWKLQKLVYYAQAWSLAWNGVPLFTSTVRAWGNGPVVPDLYKEHKGMRTILPETFRKTWTAELGAEERDVIDRVLAFYGKRSPNYLRELTHHDAPWRDARETGKESQQIGHPTLKAFYSGRTPESLEADYQLAEARKIMDKHRGALEQLAR